MLFDIEKCIARLSLQLIMGIFRNKILKCTVGMALLSILLIKFCAYSISAFSSPENSYSIEKSSEENKNKEEESLDKSKKQLLHHDYLGVAYEHPSATKHLPLFKRLDQLRIGAFPPRNVPTPPPDFQS